MKSRNKVSERVSEEDGKKQVEKQKIFSRQNVWKGLQNPSRIPPFLGNVLNKKYYDFANRSEYNDGGVDIFEEDWDNMIILDACRYDFFKSHSNISGELSQKESKASMTHEWLKANFSDRTLHDLVYVSANGNYVHQKDAMNAEIYKFIGLWNDEYRTGEMNMITPPEVVTERSIQAISNFPKKRLLVHYLQPHYPYIGEKGSTITNQGGIRETVRANDLSGEQLREVYAENLEIVLEEVRRLLSHVEGKTVVTSDHGEMLGERGGPVPIRQYGHPRGIYSKQLVEIPWLEHISGRRREIVAEEPNPVDYDQDTVEEHLKQLGYKV